jgi:hypothetical protein
MPHAYAQIFNVTGNLENFFGTKRGHIVLPLHCCRWETAPCMLVTKTDGPSADREVGAVRSNLRHPVLPYKSLLAPSGCNLGSTYKPPRQIQVSDRFVTLPAPRARVLVKCRPTRAHPAADAAGRDPDRTACTHGSLGDTAWLPSASCRPRLSSSQFLSHSFTPGLAGAKATVFVKVP